MGMTAYRVQECVADMEKYAQRILKSAQEIHALQSECTHCWCFNHQTNAYHDKLWHVMYLCIGCTLVKTEKKEPVCEKCDVTLVRCDTNEAEAEAERVKSEHREHHDNPPLAFRCPQCQKIHILWHQGD